MKKTLAIILSLVMLICAVPGFAFAQDETCTIRFETRGGTEIEPITVTKGSYATEPEYPKKDGFSFSGWYRDENLSKPFYFSSHKVESDLTLYVRWYIPFSITTWDKDKNIENDSGMYVVNNNMTGYGCTNFGLDESGVTYSFSAIPKKGYLFDGWYEGVYNAGAGYQSASPKDLEDENTVISKEKNFTLDIKKSIVIVAVFRECKEHELSDTETVKKATPTSDGAVLKKCELCQKEITDRVIPKANSYKLSASKFTYSGKAYTPAVTVKDSSGAVISSNNYTLSYANNVKAGTGKATVTFKGNYYEGSKTLNFTVVKAKKTFKTSLKTLKASSLKKNKSYKASKWIKVSNKAGRITYSKKSGNKKITVAKNGKITVKKGIKKGTYKVKIVVKDAGNANYIATSKTVTLKVKVK